MTLVFLNFPLCRSSAFDFPSFDRRCKADNDNISNVQKKIKKNERGKKAMEKAEYAFGERKLITLDFNICLIANLE